MSDPAGGLTPRRWHAAKELFTAALERAPEERTAFLDRAYADSARLAVEAALAGAPEDGQLHTLHGVALAYLGRHDEAIAEGKRGVELLPIAKDAYYGTYIQHQLARIYALVGEPQRALDELEPLLAVPYCLSPGWLRIDPNFAALRGDPRFDRLTAGG